jgi:hypothetical protein
MIGVTICPYLTPYGNIICIISPKIRPIPAPILNTGMKLPEGTGIVEPIMEKMN